jgi:hypothetical protein
MKKTALILPLVTAFFFSSCIGTATEIVIRRDGSGTIALEYRISREFESLGKLDGNEGWPPLPVGKADLERTAARVKGLSLRSFTTETTGEDVINRIKLDFAGLEALVYFLDASGQQAFLGREGERNSLTLSFDSFPAGTDPELLSLVSSAMEGYSLDFSLTLPANAELRIRDGNGGLLESPPAGSAAVEGTRVRFSSPMAELFTSGRPVNLEILW